jgi:uncharacterized membrane protein YeaQ/YmgE (transglycosylase-associated protein family)
MYLRWLTRTAILLALTVVVQMFGWPQLVTGPLVNAMLLLACIFVGPSSSVVIGLATPLVAFSRGILKAPLAPMIPFIMVGNAIYVVLFSLLRRKSKGEIVGVVAGSLAKFLVLALAVQLFTQLPPPVAKAMQWPQLLTALIGGAVALVVAKAIPKLEK